RAHGARFNCSKQLAAAEPVITDVLPGLAQCHDFSVRSGIVIVKITIPSTSNDTALAHDHCSDRPLPGLEGALGATEGLFHPELVRGIHVSQESVLASSVARFF